MFFSEKMYDEGFVNYPIIGRDCGENIYYKNNRNILSLNSVSNIESYNSNKDMYKLNKDIVYDGMCEPNYIPTSFYENKT